MAIKMFSEINYCLLDNLISQSTYLTCHYKIILFLDIIQITTAFIPEKGVLCSGIIIFGGPWNKNFENPWCEI